MVTNYVTKKTSRVLSAVVTALLLMFSVSSFGQIPVAGQNSSSLSITSFDSSYVNNNLSSLETFNGGDSGSLVIAMDNDLQANSNGYFNTYSYGLVVALLHADVPVKWAISSTKVKDGIDFSANAKKVAPSVGSTNNYDFKSGPILIHPGYEDQALSVINTYNNNLSSSSKVKVYRLTTTTSIEIRHTLFHKPKVAILNNGSNQDIHENVFEDAGLESGTHYVTNLNASDIDGTSCVTMVSEPHADDIDAQDVIAVRDFVTNGGNFFAQCAAIRHYEGEDTNQRLLTLNDLNAEDQASGSIFYDNPNDPVFQIQGAIANEGGSIKNFRIWPSNLQSGTDTKRFAYFTSGSENDFKFYGGKAANINTVSGGNVFYLGGHKYEDDDADEINGRRLLLNTLLIPPSRPASCGLVIPEPDIALIKTGQFVDTNADACANVGETVAYTFTVSNQGNVSLSNITLTDALVASFVFVSGDTNADSNLDVTETWSYSGVYSITQADIDAGLVLNTATVQGEDFNSTVVTDISGATITDDNQTETTLCQDPAIALVKTGVFVDTNSDLCANVSETIDYEFTITNQGNVSLSSILLTDPLVTNAVYTSGDDGDGILQVGETWICNGSYAITQQDIDAGEVVNSASVSGTSPTAVVVSDISGDTVTNDTPTVTDVCQAASVVLVKVGTYDDGDCTAAVGDVITYTFSVSNTGNVTLSNVIVDDPLVTISGVAIASLAPGAIDATTYTASYTITQQDIDAGVFSNQATVTGTAPSGTSVTDLSGTSTTNDTPTYTPICQAASVALVKVGTYDDGDCTAAVGDVITYTFSVSNTGNVTLTNVIVDDPLVTMLGGPIISLAPGAIDATTYTASYTITQQDIDAGVFSNQATVTAAPPTGVDVTDLSGTSTTNDTPTDTPICQAASIALVKVGTYDDGDCTAAVGDVITYAFSVSNTGNVTLSNVIVEDPLVTMLGGPIVSLAPGAIDTTTYTASYTITQQDIDAGVFSNQATVTAAPPTGVDVTDLSGTSVDNDTPTDTPICQDPAIALVKQANVTLDPTDNCYNVSVGGFIDYTFTVTNQGNVSLSTITLSDALVTTAYVSGDDGDGVLQVSETWIYSGSYAVTQSDIDTEMVTNTATVSGTSPIAVTVTDISGDTITNDVPTITQLCPNPGIAIIKIANYDCTDADGNPISMPGDEILYTFSVKNTGGVTLTNILVTDPLVTVNGGPITLAPGEEDTTTFTAVYIITQNDIDNGFVENQARVEVCNEDNVSDGNCNGQVDYIKLKYLGATQNATIKVIEHDGQTVFEHVVQPGEEFEFFGQDPPQQHFGPKIHIYINNTYTQLIHTSCSVAIGIGSVFGDFEVIDGTSRNGGPFIPVVLEVCDIEDLSDDGSYFQDDPTVTDLCQGPSIALVKEGSYNGFDSNGNCIAAVGDIINYTFTVTNTGNVTLTNVIVEDPLVTISGVAIATLAPGAIDTTSYSASYVITQQDIDAGLFTNQATASGTTPDTTTITDLSDDTSNLENDPTDTLICNTPSIALVKVGTYDGSNTSGSQSPPACDLTINLIINDWIPQPARVISSGEVLCITETGTYYGTITVDDGGHVIVCGNATIFGAVTINPGGNYWHTETTGFIGSLKIFGNEFISEASCGGSDDECLSEVGDTIDYAFTVTNTGSVTLTDVVVTDPLVTVSGGPIASLAPGASDSTSYTASYAITQQDIDAGLFINQATVTATPPMGANVTDLSDDTSVLENDPTVTILCGTPSIALVKVGMYDGFNVDGECISAVGDTINYTFSVTNTGSVTLTNVEVTDPLVTINGAPIASLAPGVTDSTTFIASYVITQQDIDAGLFSNQATATGTAPDTTIVTDLSGTTISNNTPTVTDICQNDAIAITKAGVFNDVDANGCTSLGVDTVTYTFTVTNAGNTSLTSVTVTDPLLGGLLTAAVSGDANTNGVLDITETWVYVQDYVVTQSDIDTGSITNQATASGTGVNGLVTDLSGATISDDIPTVTIIPEACLDAIAITKAGVFNDIDTSGCSTASLDTVTYTFTVTNQGNTPLTGVTVTDPLLGGLLTAVPTGDTNTNGVLDITETWVYVQDYVVTQSDIDTGSITNQATASGTGVNGLVTDLSGATISDDIPTVTIIPEACLDAIAITKTGVFNDIDTSGCSTASVDTVTYTFTVTNQGNTPLTSVTVTDPLLGGLLTAVPTGDANNNTILEVTETWVYVQDYVVTQSDIDTGSITNQATASGTGVNGLVTDLSGATISDDIPTVTIIPEACLDAIAITKTGVFNDVDTSGCSTASVDTVTYTFTVTNQGNTPLTSVTVTDPLLGGLLTAVPTGDANNNTILEVTETWVYVQDYVVTQSDIDTGSITNQATASGTGVNGLVTDLSGATVSDDIPTVTIIPEACLDAIAITKAGVFNDVDTSGCSTASVDTVTYTFTVTNQGNTPLTSVTVTDPLLGGLLTAVPTGDANNNTILEVTETWVYVQDYVVTQSDIDTGSITNQATASGTGVNGLVTDLSGATISDDIPTVTIIPEACLDAIAITKTGVFNDVDTSGCSTASVDTVTYTFTVTNQGNTSLTSVTVTDPLLGGLLTAAVSGDANTNGVLDITETWVYVQDYVVTQSDIDTGSITNQATASGTGVNGLVTDLSGATISDDIPTVTIIPEACLDAIAITKAGVFNDVDTSGCSTASLDTVTYTFTVTNQGNTPLTGVTVTDPLLGGLLTAVPTGDTNTNGVLDITETWVYVQDYVVTQSDIDTGSITNQATASGTGVNGLVTDLSGATISDDIPTVTIIPEACLDAIAITKTGVFNDIDTSGCSTASVDTVTYTFTVTNQGNTPLTSVTVTDPLLGGLLTAVPTGDANNNTILEVTETWVYVQDYVVTQSDIDTGSITNQATASGTGVNGLVTDLSGATISDDIPTVTIIPEACLDAIAITKTGVFNDVDTSGCSTASVDTVTYTFTVTNQGNTPLTSVTVTDPLLGGLLTAVPTGDANNNTILEVTETWVYVQDYVVTQSDIDTGSITNQATASGTGVNGLVTDLSGATVSDDIPTVTIIPEACLDAIAITKAGVFNDVDTSGCSTASVDTVTYTFTVTNQGNTPLTSVTVTDPLLGGLLTAVPTGDANNNTILEVTETWVYVQDYVVTQSDIDTGSITNQATASGTGVNGLVTDLSGATISDDIPTVTIIPEACLDAIAITKTGVFNDVDTSGCSTASVDTVTYTFTVTNQGNTSLTSVTVTDPLLGGLLTAAVSGDANTNGVLDITETWVYVQDYVVTQSDIDTGSITNQATASGTGVNGLVTDLSGATISDDIPTVTIIPEACLDAIAITKAGVFNDVDTSGCSTASVDTVTYTFTVTNQGNTPLTSVTVTDPLLGGLLTAVPTGDTNTNGILEVTETWVYVQDYVVTQSDIDTGSITNQATASGTGVNGLVTDLSGATISDDIPTVTIIPEACLDAIAITKAGVFNDIDTSGCSTASLDTVTYTFTVTNQGNTPLTGVTVTDPLLGGLLTAVPTGDTNTNGVLDITETWVYVQDYVVTQSDIDTGSITNQATASGTGVNGLVTDLSGATISDDIPTVTIIPEACLDAIAITKAGVFNDIDTSGCSTASLDTVTYTFTVTNQGNTPLTGVTVTDPLLGGLLTAVPTGDANNNTILEVTETWVYVQDYVVTQSDIDTGSITNQATASGTGVNGLVTDLSGATVSDDIPTVTIIPEACLDAIAITKAGVFNDVDTSGCSTASVDTVTYTFTVTNQGNTPLTSVTVTDPLLGGLLTAVPTGDANNNTILEVTETWVYVQDYVVTQSDIDTGSITNQATASGTGVNGLVTDLSGATISDDIPTVTIIPEACLDAIAITKTGVFNDVDTSGCSTASVDTVTYTFTVTNQGNTSLTSVTVTDPLLGGLLTAVPTGDANNNTILEVTETWVYVQDYVVTQSDIDTGSITNQATASGTGVNGLVTDLSGATISDDIPTVTIIPEACLDAIAITKTGVFNDIDTSGCSTASVDTVTYTFTVTNQGNTPLTSVTVTDPLLGGLLTAVPTGDTNTNGILEVTETWVYVQDYVVTQSDIDTGSITNQATASGTGVNGLVTDLSGATISDDIPTVTIIPEACLDAIAITKAGVFNDIDTSGCSTASLDTVTYTFTVTNQGNTPLTGVTVTDPLLGGLLTAVPTGDTNTNGVLDITETWVYVQDYVVTQSDIDTGSITNQATASGTGVNGLVTDLSGATISDDIPTVTIIPEACLDAIAITKAGVFNDIDTSGCSTASLDTVTYTFTVTNQGNTPLTGVTVTDPLLGGLLTAVPTGDANNNTILEVTETWVYVQDYVVTQSDIDTGSITNQATASGTGVNGLVTDLSGATVSDDIPTVTIIPEACLDAIAITKTGVFNDIDTSGCSTASVDTVTYTFTVTNQGNTPLTSVTVTDPLLGGLLTAVPTGDTNTNGILEVTETWVYVQDYVVTQSDIDTGSITNQATASGTGVNGLVTDLSGATVSDDIPTVTTLCQNNAIALIKTGVFNDTNTDNCADVNETITYSFVVKNTGNTTISNIDIEDAMVNVLGGPITLAPGEEDAATFTAVYLITQVDIDLGSITNTAIVSGLNPAGVLITDTSDDDSFLQDDPTVTTLCQNNAIALIKTGVFNDVDGDQCADVKETITYTFMVKNTGNTTISGVDIEDAMVNVQGGPITLAPGQEDTTTFSAIYLITQADIDTGSVTNTATVTGVTSTGVVVSDISDDDILTQDDPTITPLCNLAVIALIKTAILGDENGDGCIDLGETIIYDFVVTNLGNVPLTQVIVTDPMVTVQGGPVTILAGESDTESFFAIYIVTQGDVENGQISNQAIAEGLDPSGNVVNDLSDDNSNFENDSTVSILCQDPSIFLEKEGVFNDENNSGFADVGETISYYFTVTNTGNLILFNITVEDPLPGLVVQGGPIALLEPGQIDATTFTATYVITQADIDLQRVVNQATVRSVTANNIAVIDTSDDPTNLTNSDPDSDGDPDDPTITPLPSVGGQFEIFNAVSADENGENDFFFVSGISDWPDNTVQIFNRWGVKVFETSGYGGSNDQENVFRGYSDGRQTVAPETLLPTGTYYYIITFNGPDNPGKNSYAGYLYLNR